MGEAQAARYTPVGACRGAAVNRGGYRKRDIETRHPDLVGGLVQRHAVMFFPSSAAPRAGTAQAGAVVQPPRPACLGGGVCN